MITNLIGENVGSFRELEGRDVCSEPLSHWLSFVEIFLLAVEVIRDPLSFEDKSLSGVGRG